MEPGPRAPSSPPRPGGTIHPGEADEGVRKVPVARWTGVCLDCRDGDELARFYEALLGWAITASDGRGWYQLSPPEGGVGINIQAEPWYEPPTWPEERGQQHKMMHFEVEVTDLEAAIQRVLDAGGHIAEHQPPDRDPSRLRVMLDPANHPFCLFVSGE